MKGNPLCFSGAALAALLGALVGAGWREPPDLSTAQKRYFYDHTLSLQARQDPLQPAGAVVFLGDSLTQGMPVLAVADRALNYGVSGQTAKGLLEAMPTYGAVRRARLVVLTIGTNDVGNRTPLSEVEATLRALSAAIPGALVWNGVPPTKKGDVGPINALVRRLCAERADCRYTETPFQASDFRDGTHLTREGYARWVASLGAAVSASGAATSSAAP